MFSMFGGPRYVPPPMPMPGPVDPLVDRLKRTTSDLQRMKEQQENLMTAIQRDLALIRSKCGDCDCPKDVPSTDCPNNVMSKTMSALVHITMENLKGE